MEDVPPLVCALAREGHLANVVVVHPGSNHPDEDTVIDEVRDTLLAHDVERVIFVNRNRPIGPDVLAHSRQEWFIRGQTHLRYEGSETYVNAIREKLESNP